MVLTFTNPEFSCFCYNLALKILLFLRLFSLIFATTRQHFQISSLFDYKNSPQQIAISWQKQKSIVVCRRVNRHTKHIQCSQFSSKAQLDSTFVLKIQSTLDDHFCRISAHRILHFSRLFSINSATK
jgi:hypothetical protein